MKKEGSRRSFIGKLGKAALAASLMPSVIKASEPAFLGFQQNPLPYAYDALSPYIDTVTMDIHYNKHAATYTKNLNDACSAEQVDTKNTSLETLMANISKYSAKMRNNGGGHFNHEFFWQSMKPGNSLPSNKVVTALTQSFGSIETFKTQFADAGKNRFGSGWAWLVQTADKKLVVGSTPNQDNPLMPVSDLKGIPLLALDVWEHAYYLNYQNRRADYINAWWNIVNWEIVEKRMI